jgi:hypothetical protein
MIEFTFDHPIGKRAVECLSKPKLVFVSAGRAAAAAVGGGVSASLGSSAAGGSGGGAMGMIGVVQFMALLADNCGTQTDVALQDFLALLTPLQAFNLRFPMPDVAIFSRFREWSFIVDISLCGMGGIDLLEQARSDVGSLFSSNVVIGAIGLTAVASLHFLLLLPCHTKWRHVMTQAAPFLKWETLILMLAFQGLLVSSFQMIALDEPLCKYAGFAVLLVPTWMVMFVTYILVRFVRPSSLGRLVRWDTEQGKWSMCKGASESEGSTGDNTNARATGDMERRRPSGSNSRRLSAVQARKSLVGAIALTVAEIYSAPRGSLASEAAEASRPDVAIAIPAESSAVTRPIPILARSLSRRLYRSIKDSLSGDLLGRYAHFFDAYVSVRGAWLTLPLLLLQQYVMAAFLGLAAPSGGCDYEQVSPFCVAHHIRKTCPFGMLLISCRLGLSRASSPAGSCSS